MIRRRLRPMTNRPSLKLVRSWLTAGPPHLRLYSCDAWVRLRWEELPHPRFSLVSRQHAWISSGDDALLPLVEHDDAVATAKMLASSCVTITNVTSRFSPAGESAASATPDVIDESREAVRERGSSGRGAIGGRSPALLHAAEIPREMPGECSRRPIRASCGDTSRSRRCRGRVLLERQADVLEQRHRAE